MYIHTVEYCSAMMNLENIQVKEARHKAYMDDSIYIKGSKKTSTADSSQLLLWAESGNEWMQYDISVQADGNALELVCGDIVQLCKYTKTN